MQFIKKNKKPLILIVIAIVLILTGVISWDVYFSKYKIFNDYEKEFTNTAKRYYSMNQIYLPENNQTREITLQQLYDGNHITDLYIPKTKKLCDGNSWVRVYNDNGNYKYTTYLKCGKFESHVDHTGPEITLNGDKEITLAVGSNYEELGVNKVFDKVDGSLDTKNVIIDSNVDTNKIGVYTVTYTVRDKSYNKTVVTRKITVARNLTTVVKEATDESNYYKGLNPNNYLLFSGMLYRIVKVNEDGTIQLISDEAITNLRADYTTYQNSNIDTWLNQVYYNSLHNANDYLVDTTYCVGDINSIYDYSKECDTTITSKVGLLNISSYNATISGNVTYLKNDNNYFALSHKSGNKYIVAPYEDGIKNGLDTNILAPIRPVITLKSNLYLLAGDGTQTNPYKLSDYSYANNNDLLNTRLTGEYIKYSGLTFRIIGVDDKNNVKVIMASPWNVQPNNKTLQLSVAELDNVKFNLEEESNPGYILNNDLLDYIDTKYIVDTNYTIPKNVAGKKFNEYETTPITTKILLPTTFEMFSSPGNDTASRSVNYLYIDSSSNNNMIYMINGNNELVYEVGKDNFYSYNIRAVLSLDGNLKIASGNGTVNKPYTLK